MKWIVKVWYAIDDYEYVFRNLGKSLLLWSGSALLVALAYAVASGGIL